MDCASLGKPFPPNAGDGIMGSSSSQLVLVSGLTEIIIAKPVIGRMLLEEVVEVLEIDAY